MVLLPGLAATPLSPAGVKVVFSILALVYATFASVSIWRSAGTVDVSPIGALAKVYAVVSFLLLATLVFFIFRVGSFS